MNDALSDAFVNQLETAVGALLFTFSVDGVDREGYCIISQELYDDGEGVVERFVFTTAKSYGVCCDRIVTVHFAEDDKRVYRVGPDLAKDLYQYRGVLFPGTNTAAAASRRPASPATDAALTQAAVYTPVKNILKAGTNVSITEDDTNRTLTIASTATGSGGTTTIPDGSITEEKLADDAVTEDKIKDGAVTRDKLSENVITRAKIADNAVGTAELGTNSVTGIKIATEAVGSDELADGAVDADHLQNGIVNSSKIANNAVGTDKLSLSVNARLLPSAIGTAGQILQVNSAANGVEYSTPAPSSSTGITGVSLNYVTVNTSPKSFTGSYTDLLTTAQTTALPALFYIEVTGSVNNKSLYDVFPVRKAGLGTASFEFGHRKDNSIDVRISGGRLQIKESGNATNTFATVFYQTITTTTA